MHWPLQHVRKGSTVHIERWTLLKAANHPLVGFPGEENKVTTNNHRVNDGCEVSPHKPMCCTLGPQLMVAVWRDYGNLRRWSLQGHQAEAWGGGGALGGWILVL